MWWRKARWTAVAMLLAWLGGCASWPPAVPSCGRSATPINAAAMPGDRDGR